MRPYIQKFTGSQGMTLVEVMVSVLILTIGILGTLSYFTGTRVTLQMARDKTTAVVHAEYILEEMRTMSTLSEITSTDWEAFAQGAGLNTISEETVTVTYQDPDADPLNVTVTVGWVTGSRQSFISLVTEITE